MGKSVGLITIHGINNFGSLLQAYATQNTIEKLGYSCTIINYKYPNKYHLDLILKHSPYAIQKFSFFERLRISLYRRSSLDNDSLKKQALFEKERKRLLHLTEEYPSRESLLNNPPSFDIYVTGSDQVWNPRYLYDDTTFLLSFIGDSSKIAFSASFGATEIDDYHMKMMKPFLQQYQSVSVREESGTRIVKDITGEDACWTCDPTLLLTGTDWSRVFPDDSLIEYILVYVLTYTANPYPYASDFISYVKRTLKKKVVVLDETGKYWMDMRYKSFQAYGPREIISLFRHASFIISSSFHGAAFSVNFQKDFYSIFPQGVKDERQESFLRMIGASDRFIRVGDPFPSASKLHINNWNEINEKLNTFRSKSLSFLSKSLKNAEYSTR